MSTKLFYKTGNKKRSFKKKSFKKKSFEKKSFKKKSFEKKSFKKKSFKKKSFKKKSFKKEVLKSKDMCKNYDDSQINKELGKIKPRIGSEVIIIVKPYNKYECVQGFVSRVLTNKEIHTRGHKVILENGIIGRTLKIIKL